MGSDAFGEPQPREHNICHIHYSGLIYIQYDRLRPYSISLYYNEDGRNTPMEAYLTLYGHQRSIRLPIYGAKVFAVRKGKIDLHGCRITTTWTEMDQSSEIGDSTIRLTHPVADDWYAGDEVVIASTGDIHHLHHSEQRTIASVSSDGYEITFTVKVSLNH